MQYQYTENENFEDVSSGRVILQKQGATNFPVRLALEIYRRCLQYVENKKEVNLYDPCCGSGYLLTVIGLLHMTGLKTMIGSDIDRESVAVAQKNLQLLTVPGLTDRFNELQGLYTQYQKLSHRQAMDSAQRLIQTASKRDQPLETVVFEADLLRDGVLRDKDFKADIVFTDVPYGKKIAWQGDEAAAIDKILDNLLPVITASSVVAICSDKQQKISARQYTRLEKQQVGKRKFEIFALKTRP